jgi:hypothetical protein
MGPATHRMNPIHLKDGEGEIGVIIEGWKKPSEEEAYTQSIDNCLKLFHEPCCYGRLAVVRVSDTKQVLFCNTCGLRINLGHQALTLGDLRKFLS